MEPSIFLSHILETKSLPSQFVLIKTKEIPVSFVLYMYMYISKHFIQASNLLLKISKFHQTSKQQKEKKKKKISPFQRIGQSFLHVTDLWESR